MLVFQSTLLGLSRGVGSGHDRSNPVARRESLNPERALVFQTQEVIVQPPALVHTSQRVRRHVQSDLLVQRLRVEALPLVIHFPVATGSAFGERHVVAESLVSTSKETTLGTAGYVLAFGRARKGLEEPQGRRRHG
uniref:Uncharacterized protein n=1 Tax=Hyaloperonospora arabidopsidis (strain Emoy2) TaxID=559515 RepID=M4BCH3_HYAAE